MPKTNHQDPPNTRRVFPISRWADMTTETTNVETIKTRIVKALAEARKARHHKDCHCRRFDGRYCNAAAALWERALERELANLKETPQ